VFGGKHLSSISCSSERTYQRLVSSLVPVKASDFANTEAAGQSMARMQEVHRYHGISGGVRLLND
jgi:hypothetical protein